MLDGVNVVASLEEMMNLPFFGERVRQMSANVTAARYDQTNEDEMFGFPLALPSVPSRNYFVYGKPIDTSLIDPHDKDACKRVYEEAQNEVRRGLDDILRARKHDPFRNTPRRLAHERLFGKIAPTFPVDELN
jgi:hypothetical protein